MANAKHKLIIFEGADKVGKTATIDKLVTEWSDLGYNVQTLFHDNRGNSGNKLIWSDSAKFNASESCVGISLFELIGTNILNSAEILRMVFDSNHDRPLVVMIDRLHLSNIVFGLNLRPDSFNKVWGNQERFVTLMNIFERQLSHFCDVTLICCINAETIDAPDNEREAIKLSIEQLEQTNLGFEKAFDMSVIPKKYLVKCKRANQGWFDTYEQIHKLLFV